MTISLRQTAMLGLVGLAIACARCSAPSGGGSAGGSDADAGNPLSSNENGAKLGCDWPPPQTLGANGLPAYEFIPTATVPRFIRAMERTAEVDLSGFFPTPCNQGTLNSCVGWIGGYELMTCLAATNIDGWIDLDKADRQFSPTFVFNQSNAFRLGRSRFDSCLKAGTFLVDMFMLLRDTGCATWADMPYTVDECEKLPGAEVMASAADFRISTFNTVDTDVATIQSYLDVGIPVAVVLGVGQKFGELSAGEIYDIEEQAQGLQHAVVAVGYDPERRAIKIMNSWGTEWGDGGFGLLSFDIWPSMIREAYVTGRELASPIAAVGDGGPARRNTAAQGIEDRLCVINPLLDSDGDGYLDTVEAAFAEFGLDPAVPDENPDFVELEDGDDDGWPDETETVFGTDLNDAEDFPFNCDYEFPEGFFDEFINPPSGTAKFAAPRSLSLDGSRPLKILVGDLNGDGSPDLAVSNRPAGEPEDRLDLFLNDGAGGFGTPVDSLANTTEAISGPADLDGDGDLDLLTATGLLLNDGNGVFQVMPSPAPAGVVRTVGDLDGDGDVDLAGEFPQDREVSVALNNGDATFATETVVGTLAGAMRDILAQDLDGDGDLDLVVTSEPAARSPGSITVNLSVLINTGSAAFAAPVEYQIGDEIEAVGTPIAADLDADGDHDLIVPRPSTGLVTLLFNEGAPSFGSATGVVALESGSLGVGPAIAAAGDLDADGDTDLSVVVARASTGTGASAPATTELVFLINQGDGTSWTTERTSVGPAEPAVPVNLTGNLAAADLDGDGDLDLAAASITSDEVVLLFNEAADADDTPDGGGLARQVLHLEFEGNLADSSSFANNGTPVLDQCGVQGTITFEQGCVGQAMRITDQAWVEISHSESLDLSQEMTLTAWVNPAGQIGTNAGIFFKGALDFTQADYQLVINNVCCGSPYAASAALNDPANAQAIYDSGGSLTLNQWHHLAASYDGATLRLYYNGEEVAISELVGTIDQSEEPLFIGNRYSPCPDPGNFQGLMDDLRIYSSVLSPEDIRALYADAECQ